MIGQSSINFYGENGALIDKCASSYVPRKGEYIKIDDNSYEVSHVIYQMNEVIHSPENSFNQLSAKVFLFEIDSEDS